jgi:ferredoxin
MPATRLLLYILSALTLLGCGGFAWVSYQEGERRATKMAAFSALVTGLVFLVSANLPSPYRTTLLVASGVVAVFGFWSFFLPIGKVNLSQAVPHNRVDERDIMFARARLVEGSPEFNAYYLLRPENKRKDDLTRSLPGLLSLEAELADRLLFASPQGSFILTEALHSIVDGEVASKEFHTSPEAMTSYIKNLGLYYGALQVGITRLQPYHVYSHIGRGSGIYGASLAIEHSYAIAFTVEMDHAMIGANPEAPGVVESARQYVEVARVAVQLAAAIRYLGYPARAHIDGDYRVICPLVGRDAGLGEIGRMGLLMTAHQGPRVRLGVVTTNLELIPDQPSREGSVIDFCTICKKCAANCPVRAIPFDERKLIDGVLRWQIDADVCFRYWNVVGTDCGRCMTVCPYSHPDNFYHNLVRWGVNRSGVFRRLALRLDDWVYGKKPAARKAPKWMQPTSIDEA